uniref:Apple domain-containing protein n=1 Tax=Ascaris lumbricoides TaxID=6252 RepID=A0A0M3HZ36_ASCLU
MVIPTNAVKCTVLLAFLVCGVSSIFTSSFFTLRNGSNNPFRMFPSVTDRDTRDDSSKKDGSLIDANDTALKALHIVFKDESVLEKATGQSARRARSSTQKCGTPKMHSFLLHPSPPVIYWTFRKDAETCVQDFGFGIRLDGANAFSNIEESSQRSWEGVPQRHAFNGLHIFTSDASHFQECVRECCLASCRPVCCADIAPSYVGLTYKQP